MIGTQGVTPLLNIPFPFHSCTLASLACHHSLHSRTPQKLVYHEGAFLLFSKKPLGFEEYYSQHDPASIHGIEIGVFVGGYWVIIHAFTE